MIWNWIWCKKGHSNLLKKWMKINWIINSSCLFCFDIGSNLTETAELRRLGSWPAENRWVHDWFYARSFSVIKWRIFFFGKLEAKWLRRIREGWWWSPWGSVEEYPRKIRILICMYNKAEFFWVRFLCKVIDIESWNFNLDLFPLLL